MKKTITKISFIAIMLCVVMLAANCKKDETTTTPPADARDIFIGNFHMSDSSKNFQLPNWSTSTLDIVISKNLTDASKINIMNLNKSGKTVNATVSGSIFIITDQAFGDIPDVRISGSGKFENSKLSYEYTHYTTGSSVDVRGHGTKFTK